MSSFLRNLLSGLWLALAALPSSGCAQSPASFRPTVPPAVEPVAGERDAATILSDYARAWRGRQEMPVLDQTVVLGFRVADGGEFHVVLPPEGAAEFETGLPPESPGWVATFELDLATLQQLDRGEINALTAMGQARASDPIPLTPRIAPAWTPQLRSFVLPLFFHFWNREWPEVVRFGEGTTRVVHGANAAVLYYDQGLRSAWYQIKPGMRANEKAEDQSNPFDSLLIVTRGRLQSRLAGIERVLHEGEAVLIPAGMSHQFWAGDDDYAEAVLIMFGGGA